MLLFDLLRGFVPEIAPEACKLHLAVGHAGDEPRELFAAGTFEEWQSIQTARNFQRPYVLTLISLPGRKEWLFAGLYRSLGARPIGAGGNFRYELQRLEAAEPLAGRAVVEFTRTGRQSYLRTERWADQLVVAELLRRRYSVGEFPGFKQVRLTKAQLDLIVAHQAPSWRAALSSVAGVYVITDRDSGQLYVGSATGEQGLWGRWSTYAKDGHGGNRELRALLRRAPKGHARNFQYGVLEIADTHASTEEILGRERHWKELLATREHGLNAN